jgi:hypothetical protein
LSFIFVPISLPQAFLLPHWNSEDIITPHICGCCCLQSGFPVLLSFEDSSLHQTHST